MKLSSILFAGLVAVLAAVGIFFHDPAASAATLVVPDPASLSGMAFMGSAAGLGSRSIIGKFYARFEATLGASWVGKLCMHIDSNQESETYKWLGAVPGLREWVGGRQAKGLRTTGLTIVNKVFEATLKVLVDEIRRDKTGQVMVRVNELADSAVNHIEELVTTLIITGDTSVCYDGQYFFDTDHAEGNNSTSQANLITFDISDSVPSGQGGTATSPTAITMQYAILDGVAKILGFKDDENKPMNPQAKEFIVMAGPSLMRPVLAATSLPTLEAGAANLIKGAAGKFSITPEINPRLTAWTSSIAVFRADGNVKPFIEQEEQGVSVDAVAEGSEHEFKEREHLYGVTRIGNVGYGVWQHACKVNMQA